VPLQQYREWIERQSVQGVHVGRAKLREGFRHLIIDPTFLEQLGPAVNSSASIFLYGDPGNGKTVIAEAIAHMMGGGIFIPQSVDIDGQVMILYDPVHHRRVEEGGARDGWLESVEDWDRRFVQIRRPVIFVGGELTLAQLDLQYDHFTKTYQAPFQLKAAGGVLVIDDFGRQLVSPRDLLNRWIVPLEKRVDYLGLHTGVKFPVPFDALLIFATNLNPGDLVDEAFLRRIQYKVHVGDPSLDSYSAIFRMECERRGLSFDQSAVEYLFRSQYGNGRSPRCCHPRDILDHLMHITLYEERTPELSNELLDRACESYFLVMDEAGRTMELEA
jgi:predicted ATPase with chaperone activity